MDFEKLINAPLPKVPREISFTAHWLAVEGVQPSIPQNPTSADSRHQELLPKGPGANSSLTALSGQDSVTVKPLVKHILSSELQLYFERITHAILNDDATGGEEYRNAAFSSLQTDPGLHQLLPYFSNFVSEKVTHKLKDLFVLRQMLNLCDSLLRNQSLYIDPYISSFVPPVLTCLIAKYIGLASDDPKKVFELRDHAASLILSISKKYGKSSQTLKPRLARTMLKTFLDPNKTFGPHYGALVALQGLLGSEGVRVAVLPNLKLYDQLLQEGLADENKKFDAEMVITALLASIEMCGRDILAAPNGEVSGSAVLDKVVEKIGEALGNRVVEANNPRMVKAILEANYGE